MRMMVILTTLAVAVAGCADMTPQQQRALTGAAIGTAGGAAIGAIAGNAGLGAGIGAAAGLTGGLLVNRVRENEDAAYRRGVQSGLHAQRRLPQP